MSKMRIYDSIEKPNITEKENIINFLHQHLEEFGDPKHAIKAAIDFALKETPSFGGFVITTSENDELIGAVVVNQTGMQGYIPENILVYIATHKNQRGKGVGKKLMKKALDLAKGDVALHVEANNPAKFLYEKVGFTNPYLEMRLKRTNKKD